MRKYFALAALAFAALVSCQKEIAPAEEPLAGIPDGYVEITLTANCDVTTRSFLDGKTVTWEPGEEVAVFTNESTTPSKFTVASAEGSSVVIYGAVPAGATSFTAVYPFESAVSYRYGVAKIQIPREQQLAEGGTIAPNALCSVAVFPNATTKAQFKNVVSLLSFQVGTPQDVTGVIFNSWPEEEDAEAEWNVLNVEVSADSDPVITNPAGGFKTQVLAAGAFAADATYYVAVPPCNPMNGISVGVCKGSKAASKVSDKKVELARNAGFNLGNIVSEDAPYKFFQIANAADLKEFLAEAAGYTATDEVEVVAEIDMTGAEIATAESFAGVLEGNNHTIDNWTSDGVALFNEVSGEVKNLKLGANCSLSNPKSGNFSFIICSLSGKVSNIVNSADVAFDMGEALEQHCFGGIVGATTAADAYIENCINEGSIDVTYTLSASLFEGEGDNPYRMATQYFGGIVGRLGYESDNLRIYGCANRADHIRVAGDNSGNPDAQNPRNVYIGGIAGATGIHAGTETVQETGYTTNYGLISECINKGAVTAEFTGGTGGYFKVGGIIGYGECALADCTNEGDITYRNSDEIQNSSPSVGGLAGVIAGTAPVTATGCVNRGTVSLLGMFCNGSSKFGTGNAGSHFSNLGGCFAIVGDNATLIENCANYGEVVGNCKMKLDAGSTHCFGGVVSYCSATVRECNNYGSITTYSMAKTNHIGGIVGYGLCPVEGCTNMGEMNCQQDVELIDVKADATGNVAGIIAYPATGSLSVKDCTNKADITATNWSAKIRLGGIIGIAYVDVTDCTNNGSLTLVRHDVEGLTNESYGGGIVAYYNLAAKISGCTNTGDLDMDLGDINKTSYVGGLVGCFKVVDINMEDCFTSGNVRVKDGTSMNQVGGAVGHIEGTSVLSNVTNEGEVLFEGGAASRQGGICGYVNKVVAVTFDNCINKGDVIFKDIKAWASGYCYMGGIAGYYGTPVKDGVATYNECINYGNVYCDLEDLAWCSRMGGIAGICGGSNNHKEIFTSCENHGDVYSPGTTSNKVVAGGIIGYSEKQATITCDGCVNTGKMEVGGPGCVGGLLGSAGATTKSTFTNFAVASTTELTTVDGGYAGLIAGNNPAFVTAFTGTVAGTVNGTAVDATNYTDYLFGKDLGSGADITGVSFGE